MTSSFFRQHRALRWLVPACVAGVTALAAGGVFSARASSESLPPRTPAQLLADVQSSNVSGFSGTIVAQLSLGLPDLPSLGGNGNSTSMASLLSGSHTMRFWYGGADRQRVALLGSTSETDVFRKGRDVWQWNSDQHVATHTVLPAGHAPRPTPTTTLTPQQLAARAIAAIDPTTRLSVDDTRRVADRAAYDLVLTPRDPATRIGSIHIAIDGTTKTPLGVQVHARGSSASAIDVSYSHISFKDPTDDNFTFTPPPGSKVHNGAPHGPDGTGAKGSGSVTTSGAGWSTVVEYRATPQEIQKFAPELLSRLSAVHGDWGRGRLLESALVSALVTDDGRVFIGAVDPSALYAAAVKHK